ncbi:microtubule-associated protein 4 isoform X4 [Kryptolebias marmoratus]|uniref:microtubule-associated protein 4 isoform X4 n=1 Tax=Kryptolebias marmoratus TaxID=37003 RepID=UPI0018ACB4A3|nr:microtubule-associated protein 4 isoform X4 [Kryptolebias marmoratus]
MAEEDLSLSDALTDSVPQPGSESVVEKDFVAQLEAETFDDQVKEMVEKKDYIPLLDNDDTRPDRGTAFENGDQKAHGVQRSEFSQSGQIVRDVEVGVVPSQVEKDPDVAELQHPTIQTVSYTPKESNSMLHETQALHVPLDLSEVKSDNVEETEKKEEKLEDNVNKLETFDTLDKVEQCSVKVECTEQQTLAKGEKEVEKGKEKEKDYEAGNVKEEQYTDKIKEAEKLAENIDKQTDTEKVKEREMEKVELVHQEEKEEDKKLQVEESLVKVDKAEKEGEVMIDKVENKDVKLEKIERNEDPKVEEKKARNFVENNEKFKLEERKVETSEKGQNVDKIDNNEKKQKTEVEDGDEQHIDKMKIGSEQQPTSVKNDGIYDKMEKKPYVEKQATSEVQDPEKGKASPNQAKKIEKETEVCGPSVRPVNKAAQKIKEEEQNKMQADKKPVEKKKTEVKSNGEGAKTPAKPAARSSITASKHHIAADKKTKLATGVSRPGNIAKSRPSNTTVCSSTTATAKCSTPLLTISTKDKKLTTPKVPSTAAGPGKKLPLSSTCRSSSQPSTTTTTRAAAPRTVPEKRPLMPKASSATTNQTIKTGTPNLASSQTASSTHITSSTVTVSSTATKRLLGTKTDSKPDTRKQLSSLKTTTGITTLSTLNS